MSEAVTVDKALISDKFADPEWGGGQLEKIGIFSRFSTEELSSLWKIGRVRSLKAGNHAVIEGELSRGLYIILSGKVSVHKNDLVSGAMHRIAYLEEGVAFGELSLFDMAPRSATVVADTQCCLFELDAQVFESHLDEKGDDFKIRFYQRCAEDLAERFRNINSDYIISQQLLWKYALRRADTEED